MKRIRFVIEVHGELRTVFSVSEMNCGDLNIHITSGGRDFTRGALGDFVAISDESLFEKCEKHISVHSSDRSSTVNVIKRTLTFEDRVEDQCQVTTGIKRDNLFVPLLFRVCGDLSRPRYLLPDDCCDEMISLGIYEPQSDQLRFMAVCSRLGSSFPKYEEHPSNLLEHQFSKFTLTLIWSYLNQPSHPHAVEFFLGTNAENGPIRGLNWFEIYNMYTELNMLHAKEYFRVYGVRGLS